VARDHYVLRDGLGVLVMTEPLIHPRVRIAVFLVALICGTIGLIVLNPTGSGSTGSRFLHAAGAMAILAIVAWSGTLLRPIVRSSRTSRRSGHR